MSDPKLIAMPDRGRVIDIAEPWERGFWSRRFSITEAELIKAVGAVGKMVVDVKRHLAK